MLLYYNFFFIPTYVMIIANKHILLYWLNIWMKKFKPMLLKSNLIHVYVSGRNSFITSSKACVLQFMSFSYQILLFQKLYLLIDLLTLFVPSDHWPKFSIISINSWQNCSVTIGNQNTSGQGFLNKINVYLDKTLTIFT